VLVIEAKRPIMSAIPQALADMMGSPHPDRLAYGLVSNGEEFIFLKVVAVAPPLYSTSKLFAAFFSPAGQDLHEVVRVLKRMPELAIVP
jgi:hypothetical protein